MVQGSIVAIVTPFNDDQTVNFEQLKELLEWHIQEGTNGIVILGTTGEASTLSKQEKLDVFNVTVKTVNKRVPVIAGTGSNNTLDTISFSREVEQLGVDALLIVAPYYNRANNQGYLQHFTMVADSVDIPIIVYNVPSRTGGNLPVEVVVELSQHPNIIGLKEASGDVSYFAQVASLVEDSFYLYSGNDDIVLPILSLGGDGVISVAANVIPNQFSRMVSSYLAGETQIARNIQLNYLELINNLFLETNPIPVKSLLNIMGKTTGGYRLPLCEPSQRVYDILVQMKEKYSL